MVKVNELRIGNKLLNDGCAVTVKYINDYLTCTTKQGNDITVRLELAKPIELTPELLEKAGFEQTEVERTAYKKYDIETTTKTYELGDWTSSGGTFDVTVTTNSSDDTTVISTAAKKCILYLHQLQNLYFCLTGEELQLTL